MDGQRQMDLEDVAAAAKRVVSLRAQVRDQKEKVKQLETQLKDARSLLSNLEYMLNSKLDDMGGEDGPLFRHLDQG